MKTVPTISLLAALPLFAAAQSHTTATQTIQLEVRSIAALEVSGNPLPLMVNTGTAGAATLRPSEESSTSYRLTTNIENMKLSVAINEPVPSGTHLYVTLGSTSGTSAGKIDISQAVSPVDAVTGIMKGWAEHQPIVYSFEADANREAFPSEARTVTLTLTN